MIKRSQYSTKKQHLHKQNSKSVGQIRIIGGQHRGRKLPVHQLEGLRPTTDRVKETLFNWIQFDIRGAHCLDLFAGSGSLGFEALSRFAQKVTFVEKDKMIVEQLTTNVATLKIDNAKVVHQDALCFLDSSSQQFDIVFLDPPFRKNLLPSVIHKLEQQHLLAANALIYVESEREFQLSTIPSNWHLDKEKTAGQVTYRLFRKGE